MTVLDRIGGRNAISAWSFVLTAVVFGVATLLPTTRDRVTGPLESRLLVAMLATAAAFVVLAVARATILRARERRARPWLALGVFALAGTVQGVALVVLRPQLDLPQIEPWLLIATRTAAGVLWLSIVAILVDEVRAHQERVGELLARIATLQSVREREEQERAATLAALRADTLDPLYRTLDAIGSRLVEVGDGERAQIEADALRRLVDEEVRPTSHALLAREVEGTAPASSPALLGRRARARIILRLATSSLAAPTWIAVGLPLVIAMLFALQGIGLLFALVVSASWVVVMTACFAVGHRLLDRRLERMRVRLAALVLLLVYIAFAFVALGNNWFWGFLSPLGRWLEFPSLFVLPALWIGLALSRAAQAKREATEARLSEAADELAVAEARRRQFLRHEYQRVGRLLHGEVQGALLSVARRLEQAAALPAVQRAEAIDEVAEQMHRLGERIRGVTAEEWSLRRALDDIAALWGGVASVRLVCAPDAFDRLENAPAARTTLVDVIAEGVTNAVRHGEASAVEVRVALVEDARVAVEIVDDGRAGSVAGAGMGSRLFDEVSPAWSLDLAPDGATLRVEVVLDAATDPTPVGV